MAARIVSYWSFMGLSIQTSRWERAMVKNLVEMGEALSKSAALHASAVEEESVAAETEARAGTEKAQAAKLQEEAVALKGEAEANLNIAASDEAKAEELETEIAALEVDIAAHGAAAAADETLAEEESGQAVLDAAEAARIESLARGEEIGVAFCELVPILDVACDIVGGVATVSLESGAAAEAVKAAGELAVASAAQIEEESEFAQSAVSEENIATDQSLESGVQADAAQKSELAKEEQLESEEKETEADALFEKSETDETLAEQEESSAAVEDADAEREAAVAVERGVAAAWNAALASVCGLLALLFFATRVVMGVIIPGTIRLCDMLSTRTSTHSRSFGGAFVRRTWSYIFQHCLIFLVTGLSFQSLFVNLTSVSLKARGGILLSFACVAAFVHSIVLDIFPRAISRIDTSCQLVSHFIRRITVLPFLYTIEALIFWVLSGSSFFGQHVFHGTILILFWMALALSLLGHVFALDVPFLREVGRVHHGSALTSDEEIAIESDPLLSSKSSRKSTESQETPRPSWLSLLWQDIKDLQIPFEILLLVCLSRILQHSVASLRLVWPTAKPMLLHERPEWIVTVSVALGSFLILLFTFQICYGPTNRRDPTYSRPAE